MVQGYKLEPHHALPVCHGSNSQRFRCECGMNYTSWYLFDEIHCECGRVHRKAREGWHDQHHPHSYGRKGCPGVR
jgi:hypothetical protein